VLDHTTLRAFLRHLDAEAIGVPSRNGALAFASYSWARLATDATGLARVLALRAEVFPGTICAGVKALR